MWLQKNLKVFTFSISVSLMYIEVCCSLFLLLGSIIILLVLCAFKERSFFWNRLYSDVVSSPEARSLWSHLQGRLHSRRWRWCTEADLWGVRGWRVGAVHTVLMPDVRLLTDWLWSVCQEVAHPVTEGGCQSKGEDLFREPVWWTLPSKCVKAVWMTASSGERVTDDGLKCSSSAL